MKKIGFLINQKEKNSKSSLDYKDVFYLFERIVKQEYGNQGSKNLKPSFLKGGKIFIKSESSAWANEVLLNKKELIKKINQEIGNEEILDIKIN